MEGVKRIRSNRIFLDTINRERESERERLDWRGLREGGRTEFFFILKILLTAVASILIYVVLGFIVRLWDAERKKT